MKKVIHLQNLGTLRSFEEIWKLQESILEKKVKAKNLTTVADTLAFDKSEIADQLLLLEHSPVYTLGKSGKMEHILISEDERYKKGIEFFKINRGGDITFHGPGQLVGYPIFDLEKYKTDLGWYLRSLEEVIILSLAQLGIVAGRSKGETGVWIDADIKGKERKICAMGIRCSRWVTMHGFALNVNTNLDYFNYIIPCGIYNKTVTSIEKELGKPVPVDEVAALLIANIEKVFEVDLIVK